MEREAALLMSSKMSKKGKDSLLQVKLSGDLIDDITKMGLKQNLEDLFHYQKGKLRIFEDDLTQDKKTIKKFIEAFETVLKYYA